MIGIFGGTFDPVHIGHVRAADTLYTTLPLQEIRFVPCKQPVLKTPAQATPQDRLAMLNIALAHHDGLKIDTRELDRTTPSYMVDTLLSFQSEYPETILSLILGMDAFIYLPQWHQWETIFDLAHIIVINRPEYDLPTTEPLISILGKKACKNDQDLLNKTSGYIRLIDLPPINIASNTIREKIQAGEIPVSMLPQGIPDYILQHGLYC